MNVSVARAAAASFRAVVFDFDGTLADSFDAIAASVNHVRAQYGLEPLEVGHVKAFVGRGPNYLLENTVPSGQIESDLACYRAHHPSVMYEMTRFLPGAHETLRTLHERGQLLGLCSNKPRLFSAKLLQALRVDSVFQAVLGPEDVPLPKPAPDMLIAAAQKLGVARDEILYIGDMTVDIQTARAAGIQVWIVPTGCEDVETLALAGPDRILTSLRDLLAP